MMDKSHDNNFFANPEFVREMRIRAQQLHQLNSVHLSNNDEAAAAGAKPKRREGFYSSPAFKREFFREVSRRNQPAVVAAPAVAVPVKSSSNDDNGGSGSKKLDERFFFCDRSFVKEMRVQAQKMHQENRKAAQNGFFDQLESRKGQCVVIVPAVRELRCNSRESLTFRPRSADLASLLVSTVPYAELKEKKAEDKEEEQFFCSRPFVRELRIRAQKMHRENSQAAIDGHFDRLESRKGQCVVIVPATEPLVASVAPVTAAAPRIAVPLFSPRSSPSSANSRCSIVANSSHLFVSTVALLPSPRFTGDLNVIPVPVSIVANPPDQSSFDKKKKLFCSRPFVQELRIRAQQMHQANVRHFEAIDQQRNALNKTGYFCSQGFKRDLFAEIKNRQIEMNAGSSSSSSSSSSSPSKVGYFRTEGFKKDLFSAVQKFEAPAPAPVVVDNSSASSSSASASASVSAPAARSVSDILRNEVDRQVFMDNLVKMKAMGFADGMVNARALLDANNELPYAVLIMTQRLQ